MNKIRMVHHEDGLGFRINLPVSSQDMLKSVRTCRALEATIEGATTRLWIPVIKSTTKTGQMYNENNFVKENSFT